jgi:hypothetical protein
LNHPERVTSTGAISGSISGMSGAPVNVTNFERAETDRMFAALQAQAGGVNQLFHYRVPTPVDQQTVIRMNRDTLSTAGPSWTSLPGRPS